MEDEQGKALSVLGTSCQVMAVWPRKVEDEMCPVFRLVNTEYKREERLRECLCSLVPGEVVVAPAMTLPLLFPHVAHRTTGRIVARRSADGLWSMEPT